MTMTGTPLVDARAPGGNRQMINAIVASVLGWSLDLFDLFILLYVAPVIGALFSLPAMRPSRWPRYRHRLP